MNIKEAKQQILNAIQAYLIKDEFGDYRISIEHQRPVFLLGAPGIGKTAIMEQIAQETGVNLVTYCRDMIPPLYNSTTQESLPSVFLLLYIETTPVLTCRYPSTR